MWTKPELKCDVCGEPMDGELPYPVVHMPLSADDRARIFEDIKKQLPQHHGVTFEFINAGAMVPKGWKLEICNPCLDKAFPELGFIKTNQIIQAIEKRQVLHQKTAVQAVAEDDD